jgi:glycosyltransferase involved in cell wall biosynthesis
MSSAVAAVAVPASIGDDGDLDLTIVIPCLNEAKTLPAVIEKGLLAMARLGLKGEVLVSDNGSTDGSIEIAKRLGARVVPCPDRGYGNALRSGMAHARGRWIIMGDADDTYGFDAWFGCAAISVP